MSVTLQTVPGSWSLWSSFCFPFLSFLLAPRYHPLAIMIMKATTRWTTRSLGLATCLNTLLSRGLHRAPPTSSQKLALSRPRTSQPDRYSSPEGRPPETQHSELCVHPIIPGLSLSRPSCPPKEWATGNCLLRSRT